MFKLLISLIFIPILVSAHPLADLEQAYLDKSSDYTPRTQHIDTQGRAKFVNHLILESSPYLLQHAHNPVNWYGFSDEAFDKAKKDNKPIFISIGYATCHWCHVMEEESFDDLEVAELINKYFIAIKVDREIHPDVDATYMNVSQLLNGNGGWPLNAIMTPNGKAFFAGVYFPKSDLLKILTRVKNLWANEQNKLINQANEIDKMLNTAPTLTAGIINKDISSQAIQAILNNFDDIDGGFGNAPKFPNESILLLLIDGQKRNPTDEQLNVITLTLDAMASGGLYDVIGGGFHRYTIESAWIIPHFEKMLYNQAQLALVYTRAYQLTKKPLYKRIAQQTLDYALREMADANGGFFSATDADSEGEEGSYFIWSINELKTVFNKKEFDLFEQWFDLSHSTEFEGDYVIHFKDINEINKRKYVQIDQLLNKLYKLRIKRIPPLTDHKILLSWNALMIPALLEAGEMFDNNKYTKAGLSLANYLHTNFYKNNELHRVSIDNKLEANALFEDYAYLANAYISAFDQTNDKIWLQRTTQLVTIMNDKFWDKKKFGFNMSSDNKYINTNNKESSDGAIPSTNGTMYQVLVKLNNRTTNKQFKQQKDQLLNAFAHEINQDPYNYSSFILGINHDTYGELANTQYAYAGRIRINTKKLVNNQVIVNLSLDRLWHINANKPLQDSLIATNITTDNNWTIKQFNYPQGELIKLGFSDEKISVYKNQVVIKINLENTSSIQTLPTLKLTLQACSDTVCLPPTSIILKP